MTEDKAWIIRVGRPEDHTPFQWLLNMRGDLTPHRDQAMRMSYEEAQGEDTPRHTFACILPWDGSWEQAFARGATEGYQQGALLRRCEGTFDIANCQEAAYMAVAEIDYPEVDHINFYLRGFEFGYYLGTVGGTLSPDHLRVEKWSA